jgi:hypothetical protein
VQHGGGLVDSPICDEAADTIARLEHEAEMSRERADFCLNAAREAQAFASHYADEVIELRATIARLEAERSEAVRWKSIHGPRLAAIEALYRDRQLDEAAGREAAATLWSERQANAILTAEVARLEAERDAARMAFYESSAWKYDQGTLTLQLMVNREEVAQVGMVPAHLAAALGGAFMRAVRAAANNQENQQVASVCGPSEQQSERDAARREAMEECARMLDAEHERSKHLHNYAACYARAIRAAMP